MGIKDSYFCSQDCFKKNWVGRILSLLYLLHGATLLTLLSAEYTQVYAQTRKQYFKPHLPSKGRF